MTSLGGRGSCRAALEERLGRSLALPIPSTDLGIGAKAVRADDPKLKRIDPPQLKWYEKFYLVPIAEGLGVTARHIAGVAFGNQAITVQYPEEQHVPSPNYRG